jgi:flagellin
MTVINTNIAATMTANSMRENQRTMENTMERLATGKRINSASDDAAGLAIETRMDSQIRGLSQASRNANDGISLLQTADGAASEMSDMLQRMRELSVQAQNGTIGTQDIANLNQEFAALATEIDRVANDTTFNNINILNSAQDIKIAVGADEADVVTITMSDFNLAAGSGAGVPVANIQTFTNVETDAEAAALTGVTTFIANNNTVSLDMDSLTTVNQMIGAINSDVNFGSGVAGGYTATKNDTGGLVMTANTAGAAAALTGSANTGTFTLRAGADNDQAGASTQVYDILANALAATSVEDDKVTTFTYGSNSVAVTAAAGTATATQWAAIINADAAFGDSAGTAGYTADDTGGALTMVANSSGAQVPLTVVTSAIASSANDATSIISTVGLDAVGGPMGSDISSFANISINDSVATTGVLAKIDSAIEGIATARASFGATINRLEYTVDNLNTTILNTQAAKSQIVDADYAAETTELARTQIISQASTAMLSQANQQAQSVLALLK